MRLRTLVFAFLGLIGLALAGCARPTEPASPPPRDTALNLTTPAEATRTALTLLVRHLDAIAAHDRPAAHALRDQLGWHVAARDALLEAFFRSPAALDRRPAQVIATQIQSWAALLAYYADGLDLDALETKFVTGDRAMVHVPAHGPRDDATVQVMLQRLPSQEWRVFAIRFAAPAVMEMSRPTTAPSTAPAAPP